MSLAVAAVCGLLGALVGSFANVVIHRLPAGTSIVRPRSACPACGRVLGPLELVPVASWLVQGQRCRGCGAPISARYPAVELLGAAGFAALALRTSPLDAPGAFAVLAAWWALLLIIAFIDLDTTQIPDALTLPGILVLGAATWWVGGEGALPAPGAAVLGGALGAGALTVVNRVGALVLRRFRDTRERLWPIGFDQANLAAVAGTLGGLLPGLAVAAASLALNLLARRPVRIPEPLAWAAWGVALALSPYTVGPLVAISGGLAACGTVALLGAAVWWAYDLRTRVRREADVHEGAQAGTPVDAATVAGEDEPVAMGFGDVKLAALLGVVLAWDGLLVALFVAVLSGAIVGVVQRALGGTRQIPFGPFLALGAAVSLFVGDALLSAYLGALGLA